MSACFHSEKSFSLKDFYARQQIKPDKTGSKIYVYLEGKDIEGQGAYFISGVRLKEVVERFHLSFPLTRKEKEKKIHHSCSIYLSNNRSKSSI